MIIIAGYSSKENAFRCTGLDMHALEFCVTARKAPEKRLLRNGKPTACKPVE
jgi:hypothetical protein